MQLKVSKLFLKMSYAIKQSISITLHEKITLNKPQIVEEKVNDERNVYIP